MGVRTRIHESFLVQKRLRGAGEGRRRVVWCGAALSHPSVFVMEEAILIPVLFVQIVSVI